MITSGADAPAAVDVVVIGAGINGLAVARELAYHGVSVAIFDRSDISSETSSISTRIVHGGLKYLERAEVNLVLECVRERNILFRIAPHRVQHYPMLIPFLSWNKRPGWMLAAGLLLQDILSLIKPVPWSELIGPKKMAKRWPSLARAGVKYGAVYHDSQVPLTERFCAEMVLDSAERGARFFTYTEVTQVLTGANGVTGIAWKDRHTGLEGQMSAKVVVNVAGPWIDEVVALAQPEHPRLIGPTRGSHFMVRDFPGAPDTCIFFESPIDSRPMFVLPWEGMYMLGTTDIPMDHAHPPIIANGDEVSYSLDSVNRLIPEAGLNPDDVLWSYSGVRPLPYAEGVDDPASITRDYRLDIHDGVLSGMVTVVGGKWTTHRALAEDVAKKVRAALGLTPARSLTRDALLPGARARADSFTPEWINPLSKQRIERVYGSLATDLYRYAQDNPALREVIDSSTGALAVEAWWAIHKEGAKTLGDIVLRRMATFINDRAGLDSARAVADVLVRCGEWSPKRAKTELAGYDEWVARYTPKEFERAW